MDVGGAAITCNSRSAKLPEQTFHAVVGDTTSPNSLAPSSSSLIPSWSTMLATCTFAFSTRPSVSTSKWRFVPSPFSSVVTPLSPYSSNLYRLAIHNACTWLRISLKTYSQTMTKRAVCSCSQVPSMRQALK
jgi:hypothetical protein